MFSLVGSTHRIFIVDHRVDFRLRHNGLLAIAYSLKLNPFRGDVVVFVSRNRREVRVLSGDSTGMWLLSKIFTAQTIRTRFSFLTDPSCRNITSGDLAMLLEGASYEVKRRMKPLSIAALSLFFSTDTIATHWLPALLTRSSVKGRSFRI